MADAEANVIRYARGRRPFLLKKVVTTAENGEEAREEGPPPVSWDARSLRVRDWLRSNPLHLGMDDAAVSLVRTMLSRGASGDERLRAKCWAHIVLEMADVPGNPITEEETQETGNLVASAEAGRLSEALPARPCSPETCEGKTTSGQGSASHEQHIANNNCASSPESASRASIGKLEPSEGDLPGDEDALDQLQSSESAKAARSKSLVTTVKSKSLRTLPGTGGGRLGRKGLSRPQRRNTDSDLAKGRGSVMNGALQSAAMTSVGTNKPLSAMSLIERQEYLMQKKKEKTERIRQAQQKKEIESCTHRPHKFTKPGSFSNVESIVKQQSSPCRSVTSPGRGDHFGAFSPPVKIESCTSPVPVSSASRAAQEFLDECRKTLNSRQALEIVEGGAMSPSRTLVRPAEVQTAASPELSKTDEDSSEPRTGSSRRGRRNSGPKRRKSSRSRPPFERASTSSSLLDACRADLDRAKEEQEAHARAAQHAAEAKEKERAAAAAVAEAERRAAELAAAAAAKAQAEEDAKYKFRFAANSTEHRGKIELQDFNDFCLDSFYRKRDRGSSKPGVSLLMGRREDDSTEQCVAVIFDRAKFTELEAADWLHINLHRFPRGRRLPANRKQ